MRAPFKKILVALAFALLAPGCPGGTGGVSIEPDPKAGLKGPDVVEKRAFEAALDDVLCPCGDPHTLRICLDEHDECVARDAASDMVLRLVSTGEARADIVTAVRARFDAEALTLKVTESACKGPPSAPVTVVEFGDFECPHCRLLSEKWTELFKRDSGLFRLCFKHFPLPSHPNAEVAASAATVAARAGKFWPMHDLIYGSSDSLSLEKILDMANSLGFDRTEFFEAMSDDAVKTYVTSDRNEGELAGVRGTPSVYINGRRFTERRTVDALSAWIRDAAAATGSSH